jgi:hypothetical protein
VEKNKQGEDDFADYVKKLEESGLEVKVTT